MAFPFAPSTASLPAYTARAPRPKTAGGVREPTEHVFELKDKKKKPWATLRLTSSARSASSLPTFLEGGKVAGSVALDPVNSEKILGITIAIRGSVVTGPNDSDRTVFLELSTPLWLKGTDAGDHQWPFSISLPGEVELPDPKGKHSRTYRLPQTFLERTFRASVYYELFVHIARSKFSVDNKLQTMFVYVPAIRPGNPSAMRALAYRQNGPVPGPDLDPEGWHTLSPVGIAGAVFGDRRVSLQATLSLAKPLSYTRGSVVPCSITYSCEDVQALELICTPTTTNLCLQRHASFADGVAGGEYAGYAQEATYFTRNGPRVLDINRAVWWPVAVEGRLQRRFDGEVHLPKSLKPSASISHFSLKYIMVLNPFQVTGFVADGQPKTSPAPLLQQEVEIATIYAKGPKPRCMTPPTYEFDHRLAPEHFILPPNHHHPLAVDAMSAQLLHVLDTLKDQAKDAVYALTSCMCQQSAKVKINGRTFKIIKVLGEGGFSFVYLAQDEHSGRQFALKKIRCPTGAEGVKEAMREVEAYRRFKHPNIIRILDSAVVQDPDGEGKIVYLFLPLYKRGNIQDAINNHVVNGTHFPEHEMVRLFKGTCEAIRAMHTYRAPIGASVPNTNAGSSRSRAPEPRQNLPRPAHHGDDDEDDDDDEDHRFPQPDGDEDGGFSYDGASVPLVTRKRVAQGDTVFEGDEELEQVAHSGETELVPYAHRDLKPGNIMISDEGEPILMDFGSTIKARIPILNRSQALVQQDIAAEQSTMSYRAPELYDVKTDATLDEKVDIWSLGCTLYAMAYSHSPFENPQITEQGGSMAMAVMNAQYKHPANSAYSQGFKELVDSMLKAEPRDRPDIHKVLEMTDRVLQSLA
ncbi:Pkinase-domain-containing protein [Mycena kentingensis (nom. inval.)]|nr:Pkinase-domain-containing protein [Mycena kentingensis (nom. inval.)]